MKTAEIRDAQAAELMVAEKDLRRELFNLRFQAATGEIQNPARIRTVRREIARIKTISGEKERAGRKEAK